MIKVTVSNFRWRAFDRLLVIDVVSPIDLQRLAFLPHRLADISHLSEKRAAHAGEHSAIGEIADGGFHPLPRRMSGKEKQVVRSKQRLQLRMNVAVKILNLRRVADHGRENAANVFSEIRLDGSESLSCGINEQTSNAEPASARLRRGRHQTSNTEIKRFARDARIRRRDARATLSSR